MPGEMSSKREKTVIVPSLDGTTTIELTAEDLREYSQCVESRRFKSQLLSLGTGVFTFIAVPFKASTPMMQLAKKGLASFFAMSLISVFAELRSVIVCGPILQKILQSKQNNPSDYTTPVEEKDEASSKELLDFTPSISSHDFSSPINFSSDSSGLGSVVDKRQPSQELREKAPAGEKRVTYDELWKMHKENSQIRNQTNSEGSGSEFMLEDEPIMEKKKVRTNKYGDVLE